MSSMLAQSAKHSRIICTLDCEIEHAIIQQAGTEFSSEIVNLTAVCRINFSVGQFPECVSGFVFRFLNGNRGDRVKMEIHDKF